MPNDPKQQAPKWVKPTEPKPQLYTNFVNAAWSLFDVRFTLGQLVPTDIGRAATFVIEEQGTVIVSWPEAKALRDMLVALVDSFEKTNGEIKPLKLPPTPFPPKPPNP